MFINLKNNQIYITSYRFPEAKVTDLKDMLESYETQDEQCLVINCDGVKDALCDGEFLALCAVSQSTVEDFYNSIQY